MTKREGIHVEFPPPGLPVFPVSPFKLFPVDYAVVWTVSGWWLLSGELASARRGGLFIMEHVQTKSSPEVLLLIDLLSLVACVRPI